jgi:hypothetical protein
MSRRTPEQTMRSQSKGIGSADNSASIRRNIRTIPALLHCALHWRDNIRHQPQPKAVGCMPKFGDGRQLAAVQNA